jgi:hypothetical protein
MASVDGADELMNKFKVTLAHIEAATGGFAGWRHVFDRSRSAA